MNFSLFFPIHLHAFHITFTLCMHSNFSCLCSHGLYFGFLHFTLVRCMIKSRPLAGSTRSPSPSPTASGFVAGQFRFGYWPVSNLLTILPILLIGRFQVCLPTYLWFCLFPVLHTSWFSVCLPAGLLAGQFRFDCRFRFQFSSHYRPVPFYCQPVLGT